MRRGKAAARPEAGKSAKHQSDAEPLQKLRLIQEKYRNILENIEDVYYEISPTGEILEVSPSCSRISKYRREELIGKSMYDIYADAKKRDEYLKLIRKNGMVNDYEVVLKDKDGAPVYCAISARIVKRSKETAGRIVGIMRDISARKRAEEALRLAHDQLEKRVSERTRELEKANTVLRGEIADRRQIEKILKRREKELKGKSLRLEETNAALKVLLSHREQDKIEHEDKILSNVRELVLPYVEKLKETKSPAKQADYVHIIETNLNQIISPFLRNLKSRHLNLSPKELQIADFIKEGKSTKDISLLLNVSARTVDFHRDNIRRKLELKNKKANLQTYLRSIM